MADGLRQLRASFGSLAAVFENPDLARLVIGWGGITFATWAYAIALGVYAFEQGGATAVGIAGLVRLLPGALASPFGGLLGDRHSRRLVLIGSSFFSGLAIVLSVCAVIAGSPPWVVYALAGLFTIATTPYIPAEGALLPSVVRSPQQLSAANVIHSQMDNLGFLAAALASGVLLGLTNPQTAFAVGAAAALLTALLLTTLRADERPSYDVDGNATGVMHQTMVGFRTLVEHPELRLVGLTLTALVLIEGALDVMTVVVPLQLLDLGEGSVGWFSAAWGVGALIAGGALAVLLDRGNLAAGLASGCLMTGAAVALPGLWPAVAIAFFGFLMIGFGYTFVEVAGRTLLQRFGSDETLARVIGFLETSRLLAMALGSILAPALVALLGVRGALLAIGAALPLLALLRWHALRAFEIGAPVPERHYALLRENPIFAPLPVETLESLSRSLVEVEAPAGAEVITQGDQGDRFYLIETGEVEVFQDGAFRRKQGDGDGFGEIALLRDVRRTATVRTTRPTRLLAIDRERFLEVVTGHRRSHQRAEVVAEEWLAPLPPVADGDEGPARPPP